MVKKDTVVESKYKTSGGNQHYYDSIKKKLSGGKKPRINETPSDSFSTQSNATRPIKVTKKLQMKYLKVLPTTAVSSNRYSMSNNSGVNSKIISTGVTTSPVAKDIKRKFDLQENSQNIVNQLKNIIDIGKSETSTYGSKDSVTSQIENGDILNMFDVKPSRNHLIKVIGNSCLEIII
jgi:hypothetical protein